MRSGNVDKEKRTLHLKAIDDVTPKAIGREVTVSGEGFAEAIQEVESEQLTFTFEAQYSSIALKEAIRGVTVIARDAIRLGATHNEVRLMLDLLVVRKPIVVAAVTAIEEALPD